MQVKYFLKVKMLTPQTIFKVQFSSVHFTQPLDPVPQVINHPLMYLFTHCFSLEQHSVDCFITMTNTNQNLYSFLYTLNTAQTKLCRATNIQTCRGLERMDALILASRQAGEMQTAVHHSSGIICCASDLYLKGL